MASVISCRSGDRDVRLRALCVGLSVACALLVALRWVALPASSAAATRAALGDGAWCWFGDPRAVHYDGAKRRTYTGWVAQDGDIMVSAFDHDSFARTTA